MAKIIRFPLRAAVPGSVRCREADVVFPLLHRVTVRTTTQDLRAAGVIRLDAQREGIPWEDSTVQFYALDPRGPYASSYIGQSSSEPVNSLPRDADLPSLLIRHHPSEAEAMAFVEASSLPFWFAHGFGADGVEEEMQPAELTHTCGAYFTLTAVPPLFGYPGPRIVYECLYTDSDGFENVWLRITDRDGHLVKPWTKANSDAPLPTESAP